MVGGTKQVAPAPAGKRSVVSFRGVVRRRNHRFLTVLGRSAQRPWCKLHGRFRVPQPERRGGCRRGVRSNDWRTAAAVTPSRWRWSRQLGCRTEAGPCQLHTKVSRSSGYCEVEPRDAEDDAFHHASSAMYLRWPSDADKRALILEHYVRAVPDEAGTRIPHLSQAAFGEA
jgi:hypothetical protein